LIVRPAGDVAGGAEDADANSGPWGVLAGNVIQDDDDAEEDAPDSPPTTIARVWAPDCIIKQLTGPFAAYSKFADLPRAMRVAPDATTWAGVQMWLHWSDPQSVANDSHLHSSTSRRELVWTVMHVEERLDILPSEMWMLIFSFIYCE